LETRKKYQENYIYSIVMVSIHSKKKEGKVMDTKTLHLERQIVHLKTQLEEYREAYAHLKNVAQLADVENRTQRAEIERLELEKAGIHGGLSGGNWRLKYEIERLKEETGREARAHDYTRDRLLAIIGELTSKGVFYQSRAAAWKKAAIDWRRLTWYFIYCRSPFYEVPDPVKPAKWIIDQLPAPTEGKSALDEKLGSSES
jgi:hypothetical protein